MQFDFGMGGKGVSAPGYAFKGLFVLWSPQVVHDTAAAAQKCVPGCLTNDHFSIFPLLS